MSSFKDRIMHGWNAFMNRDPTKEFNYQGAAYGSKPDIPRLTRGNDQNIINTIYNRIALDVVSLNIKHAKLDENGRYIDDVNSGLNTCLNLEANKDQTGRAFIQDVVLSLFDEGVVAIVPVDTDINPMYTGGYDIRSLRTAKVITWYPNSVRLRLYDDTDGNFKEIVMPKDKVCLIENPFYLVMNQQNSTVRRLVRKLNLLDEIDEQSCAGKLDLLIQLPYTIKSEARKKQAEDRRKDIEMQLSTTKYGIAYVDSTEKVTQLNRSVENNLLKTIEYLTKLLYSQLNITEEILLGTADEKTMLNYYARTIEPVIASITDEMKRKFLSKTARTQRQSIIYCQDPFKLVPASQLAEIADKFTRNEILTSNEIRQIIGIKPSDDPNADMLRNSNISQPNQMETGAQPGYDEEYEEGYEE